MPESHPLDDPEARRANRLYWDSEQSVNAVAETLAVSKGRLYDLIQPLPVGIPCPDCGSPLAFPNRTARDRGLVTCDACGFEGDREDLEESPAPEASGKGKDDREGVASRTRGLNAGRLTDPVILGGISLGVLAGVLLVRQLRD